MEFTNESNNIIWRISRATEQKGWYRYRNAHLRRRLRRSGALRRQRHEGEARLPAKGRRGLPRLLSSAVRCRRRRLLLLARPLTSPLPLSSPFRLAPAPRPHAEGSAVARAPPTEVASCDPRRTPRGFWSHGSDGVFVLEGGLARAGAADADPGAVPRAQPAAGHPAAADLVGVPGDQSGGEEANVYGGGGRESVRVARALAEEPETEGWITMPEGPTKALEKAWLNGDLVAHYAARLSLPRFPFPIPWRSFLPFSLPGRPPHVQSGPAHLPAVECGGEPAGVVLSH